MVSLQLVCHLLEVVVKYNRYGGPYRVVIVQYHDVNSISSGLHVPLIRHCLVVVFQNVGYVECGGVRGAGERV